MSRIDYEMWQDRFENCTNKTYKMKYNNLNQKLNGGWYVKLAITKEKIVELEVSPKTSK